MLEIQNNVMVFSFPEVHPDAVLTVSLMRTLRIPDDGRRYKLPPGIGTFPVKHVDDFKGRVPEKWTRHGGVLIPMYQSEAMWLNFACRFAVGHGHAYPFAVRVATGKTSAVTGRKWTKELRADDYMVAPEQPWLDGYVIADGVIRQFVAAPLGQGFTAEEQITGKAEFGGLQIEVLPMRREAFERRWPKLPPPPPQRDFRLGGITRRSLGARMKSSSAKSLQSKGVTGPGYGRFGSHIPGVYCSTTPQSTMDSMTLESMSLSEVSDGISLGESVSELGLAPGGTMEQQIFKDPYGIEEWGGGAKARCFVHLLNSMAWRAVTGAEPPTVPLTAADYSSRGMPWFDHYRDDLRTASGTSKTQGLKGVAELEKQKGVKVLPENQSASPKSVVKVGHKPDQVRDGVWK